MGVAAHGSGRRFRLRGRTATGLALGAAAALVVWISLPASALVVDDTPTPVTGTSTHFDGLGSPYGGCGMPQSQLETQDFIALNVYNTPGDYAFYPRPVTDTARIGMWNNGLNCGRWVKVTIADYCNGLNDGAAGQAFCRNGGSWVQDKYSGATLNMLVADSCGDPNAWCRDDPYHIDLNTPAVNRFVLNGAVQSDLDTYQHYNNRRVTWEYIPAPDYAGDIKIGFLQGAMNWWSAISISNLPNGIHGVEYLQGGQWVQAKMNADMGQSYIIQGGTNGSTDYQIRVRDADDQLVNGGRVYSFSLPSNCTPCGTARTEISYTTSGGGDGGTTTTTTTRPTTTTTTTTTTRPTTTTTTTTTTRPTTTTTRPTTTTTRPTTTTTTTRPTTTTTRPTTTTTRPTTTTTTTTRPTTTTTSTTTGGGGACTVALDLSNSWGSGFVANATVTATSAISGWKVTVTLPSGTSVTNSWSATQTGTSGTVSFANSGWNGSLAAGGSTSFGFQGSGSPVGATATCS